ncbi:hypothetical protein BC834DRAFT_686602 [Gloeopeniophorella convolvens]|nr:hypothetical protein BC834DRAFT_686602 [Gloeopeniophorella convolvens]
MAQAILDTSGVMGSPTDTAYPSNTHNMLGAAESAIAIQLERDRVAEAIAARDAVAKHLSLACRSIQEKVATIDSLRQQNKHLEDAMKEQQQPSITHDPIMMSQAGQLFPAVQNIPTSDYADEATGIGKVAQKQRTTSGTAGEEEPPKYEACEGDFSGTMPGLCHSTYFKSSAASSSEYEDARE